MIVIPAYNPDSTLVMLVEELLDRNIRDLNITIINDGSNSTCSEDIFEKIKSINSSFVSFIEYKENMGKGYAIKKGIEYAKSRNESLVVVMDADGQHDVDDVLKVRDIGLNNRGSTVLGVRNFDLDIPFRSKFGNLLTRLIFNKKYRSNIKDTQTGLRVYPKSMYDKLMLIRSNRYEFEQEALIQLVKNTNIVQQDISTIYEDGNPSSHFRKIRDSGLIYFVLLRSILCSVIVSVLDVILFSLLTFALDSNHYALLVTRVILLFVYFFLSKYSVFRSVDGNVGVQFMKVSLLVLLNTLIISAVMGMFYSDSILSTWVYVLLNTILFVFNFLIQKLVFRK